MLRLEAYLEGGGENPSIGSIVHIPVVALQSTGRVRDHPVVHDGDGQRLWLVDIEDGPSIQLTLGLVEFEEGVHLVHVCWPLHEVGEVAIHLRLHHLRVQGTVLMQVSSHEVVVHKDLG